MPYAEEDAAFFFGRDADHEIISANLLSSRFTVLYAPSGVGKTSVLRAGVAHHLQQRAQQNVARYGAPEFAVIVFSAWRDDPIAGLLATIENSLRSTVGAQRDVPLQRNGAHTLGEQFQAITDQVGGNLLIVLDQFEEYFLYHANEDGEGTFAFEFPRAITDPKLRVNFLLAIREDALAKLDRFEGRIPSLFDNYLRIEPLNREAARDAITKPIAQYNRLRASEQPRVEIEPALVDAVLDQVQTGKVVIGEAGRGELERDASDAHIETPYLQLVMTRLWEEEIVGTKPPPQPSPVRKEREQGREQAPVEDAGLPSPVPRTVRDGGRVEDGGYVLRLSTLNRLGGAERIVRTHLDNTMSALPPSHLNAPSATAA